MTKKFSFMMMLIMALFMTQTTTAFAQEDNGKQDPGISFDKESLEYVIGQEEPFVEPTLINPNNVPVYYVSDNNSAATVDFSTGKVTFITQGVVNISAISNETDLFNPAQASYQITVTDESIIFAASFIEDDCGFTQGGDLEGVNLWIHEPDGYMKADAYGVVDKMSSFYLISPEFTLSSTGNSVSFGECGSYFGNRWNDEAQLVIRTVGGDWKVLDREYPSGDQNTVKTTGDIDIPAEFNGKNVQLAFKYSSDGKNKSGVWHVRNLHVKKVAGEDTGIECVETEKAETAIYNLMGIKVDNTVKGEIYVKDGRKFIAE